MLHLRRAAVALLAACAVAAGPAVPAAAQPSADASHQPRTERSHRTAPTPGASNGNVTTRRQQLLARLDTQTEALTALTTAIGQAKQLTAAHRTALTTLVTDASGRLAALRTTLTAASTPQELKAAAEQLSTTLAGVALVHPQIRLTIAMDLEAAAVTALGTLADRFDQAMAGGKAGGDTTEASAALADMRSHLTAANAAIAGQVDALLALRPSAELADRKTQLAPYRTATHTACDHLKAAHADAKKIHKVVGEHPDKSHPAPSVSAT